MALAIWGCVKMECVAGRLIAFLRVGRLLPLASRPPLGEHDDADRQSAGFRAVQRQRAAPLSASLTESDSSTAKPAPVVALRLAAAIRRRCRRSRFAAAVARDSSSRCTKMASGC